MYYRPDIGEVDALISAFMYNTTSEGGSGSGEDSSKDDWDEEEAIRKEEDASQWGTADSATGEKVPKNFVMTSLSLNRTVRSTQG